LTEAVSFSRLAVILVGSDSCRIEYRLPDRNTDELLLERAGAGDQAAFIELYERHRAAVFRFSYRLSGSVEGAEDITHDCFLSLIKKPANFERDRASLRTYLLSAARNLWLKQLRTLGRESAIDEFEEKRSFEKEPLDLLLDDELCLKVQQAVSNLPPLQREALVLFEYEGLALSEIASMIGTDVGAVKSRIYRARERLRNSLRPYLETSRELNTNREIVTLEQA
jgi:RNA polymerase sigma-70 factor (ECF subfamily)